MLVCIISFEERIETGKNTIFIFPTGLEVHFIIGSYDDPVWALSFNTDTFLHIVPKKSCDIHTSLNADKYKLSLLLKNGFGILKVCKFRIPMRIPVGKSRCLFLMTSIVLSALTFISSNVRESLDKKKS